MRVFLRDPKLFVLMFTIMFNVYITDLSCFDEYVRAATLITDKLRIDYG